MHRADGRAARARFPLMVRTLRGLETIARTEVEARLGPLPIAVEHRALRFSVPRLDGRLLELGTVDDAFLVIREVEGIDHRRSSLGALAALARTVDASRLLTALAVLRPVAPPISFAVTASFIGRRNYSRFEIEECVARAIAAATGWACCARDALAPVSLRLHLLHSAATLSVRLAARPLHRRGYRIAARPGALYPPLARAMCLVAGLAPGDVVLDPTCGVGTIPIEAVLAEPRVDATGFDLEPAAVRAARANARRARVDVRLRIADAARLPVERHSVERVVANPPWGSAVAATGGLRAGPRALWGELARVLAPAGRIVVVLPADRVDDHGLRDAGLDAHVVAHVRVAGAEAVVLVAVYT